MADEHGSGERSGEQGSQSWSEIILYHCGRRMVVDRTMPVEMVDGLWWRHRYWKCRWCGLTDQTRDEVPEPVVREPVRHAPVARGEGRMAALRKHRR